MDHLSEAPHRRENPCKGLLITASIFSCWIQPNVSFSIVPSPPYGMVGSQVTLSIQGSPKTPCRYTWYRKSAESSNQILSYHIGSQVQTPPNSREIIFSNGSLLIPNLTVSDNDDYILQLVHSECEVATVRIHLKVYALRSREIVTSSNLIGIVIGAALIGSCIYILCIRKTEWASQGFLGRKTPVQKEGEDSNFYMNNVLFQDFPRFPQDQDSSAAPSENIYQALNVNEMEVYEKIPPSKKPQAHRKGKITKF
ncbi:cell adhesion molecule CEACAM1-like [Macrotis lagotis]|uniref:cell adhesion molecule CEACAM1-like n=1 Tax=Macrotis lagotis TaxID=92651 RepID=UPI003D688513